MEAEGSSIHPLVRYNAAVAHGLAGDILNSLTHLEWILAKGLAYNSSRNEECSWLVVLRCTPNVLTVELQHTNLRVASLATGTSYCYLAGQVDRAKMWLHGLFGIMKDIRIERPEALWQIAIEAASALDQKVPPWVANKAKKTLPNLAEILEQCELKESYATGKDDLCPCGSGKQFKNCCQRLFR